MGFSPRRAQASPRGRWAPRVLRWKSRLGKTLFPQHTVRFWAEACGPGQNLRLFGSFPPGLYTEVVSSHKGSQALWQAGQCPCLYLTPCEMGIVLIYCLGLTECFEMLLQMALVEGKGSGQGAPLQTCPCPPFPCPSPQLSQEANLRVL